LSSRPKTRTRDTLFDERQSALGRATETYKKLFIDGQLAQLDQDRRFYLGKIADAANDQDRERYVTALVGRLKLSGDVGLLHKDDADRLIESIPGDLDIFTYNREYATDPVHAQRLFLNGAYPNMRAELRDELLKVASTAETQLSQQGPNGSDLPQADSIIEEDSETNKDAEEASNDQLPAEPDTQEEDTAEVKEAESVSGEQYAAVGGRGGRSGPAQPQKPSTAKQTPSKAGLIGEVHGYSEIGKTSWRAANDQVFIDAAKIYNEKYGLLPNHSGYITPEFLKSWAMIESGGEGDRKAFLTDPFQVNDPRNWVAEKARIAGLKKGEAMTPQKSVSAALEWLRYKSFSYDQRGVPTWLGLEQGLKNYNTKKDLHDDPKRMWQNDYHPGMLHKDWYATAIMLRMFDLLKGKSPSQ